jgi:hypothetical protein
MAVSGKTAAPHEIPYYLETDSPPDMGAVSKAMAERVHGQLDSIAPKQIVGGTKGQLVVVDNTGATAFKAMKGDGTIDGEGNFQLGKGVVGSEELADGSGTEAKHGDGSVTSRKWKPTAGYRPAESSPVLSSTETKDVLELPEITVPFISRLRLWVQVTRIAGGNGPIDVYMKNNTEGDAIIGSLPEGKSQQESFTLLASLSLTTGAHTIKIRAKLKSGSGQLMSSLTRVIYDVISV